MNKIAPEKPGSLMLKNLLESYFKLRKLFFVISYFNPAHRLPEFMLEIKNTANTVVLREPLQMNG